ncbi:MAG: hypothetical protein A2Z97_03235 [Bdellovibrionales bacterium GWB1_52_6]|nr:MAG: hypothetical protein A2Z97_03235 [Bdellovibrionales bacterium GWB1_52_6]OFZ02886.1 MAG: hypothetical protein A2X97_04760 [Bdellovibrionales bacterium GWA1_52_35]HCM38469.1 hypothetical protein [Bdellovibrionales bacterium]
MFKKDSNFPVLAVEIEINPDCNKSCSYCPNSILKRKASRPMDERLFRNILEQLRGAGYNGRISFHFYNEPLLCAELDHFAALTRQALPKCFIELYTNGTLLTRERLESLLRSGVSKFTVTRHPGSGDYPFEALLETLALEVRTKIRYQMSETLLFTNRGGLMKDVGVCSEKPPLPHPCFIPHSALVITAEGNVIPCFEDYEEQNVMGQITGQPHEPTLVEIWNSARYRKFRDSLKKAGGRQGHPVCRDCNSLLIIP